MPGHPVHSVEALEFPRIFHRVFQVFVVDPVDDLLPAFFLIRADRRAVPDVAQILQQRYAVLFEDGARLVNQRVDVIVLEKDIGRTAIGRFYLVGGVDFSVRQRNYDLVPLVAVNLVEFSRRGGKPVNAVSCDNRFHFDTLPVAFAVRIHGFITPRQPE